MVVPVNPHFDVQLPTFDDEASFTNIPFKSEKFHFPFQSGKTLFFFTNIPFKYPKDPYKISTIFVSWIPIWLVVWNMAFIFPYIRNVIIPTDELIFFRGVDQPPTRLWLTIINHIIEGSLEVKLPTIWTDEKAEERRARREQSQRGEKSEEKRSEERRCRCAKR